METSTECFFNGCDNHTVPGYWACYDHRDHIKCLVHPCRNMVYARKLCVLHGGKKSCSVPGCGINRRMGAFCSKHAPTKKRCSEEGCETQAHLQGKCVRHGGGRLCKVEGCTYHARNGPYCGRHFKELGPAQPAPTVNEQNVVPRKQITRNKGKAKRPALRVQYKPRNISTTTSPLVAAPATACDYDQETTVSSPPIELLQLDLNDDLSLFPPHFM